MDGNTAQACVKVLEAFELEPLSPDVWDAFARFCGDTDFDPVPLVARIPDDHVLGVLAGLRNSMPEGVDCIVEALWERTPNDARLLAAATRFAPALDAARAFEWSVRLRAVGEYARCPLVAWVEPRRRPDGTASGRGARLRNLRRRACPRGRRGRGAVKAPDDELAKVLDDMRSLAPQLVDSVVVAGATSTVRSLRLATVLWRGDADDEAYAVLVHGLSREDAEQLDTETFAALVPSPVLEALADDAAARGDAEVATILWSIAGVDEPFVASGASDVVIRSPQLVSIDGRLVGPGEPAT